MNPESWGCGRRGAGGGCCPSVVASGARGRGVPGEEQEEVRGSGVRLGPREPRSARSWLADSGKYGLQAAPLLSPAFLPPLSPPSLPPHLLFPPPSLDVGCRLEPGGTGRGTAKPPAGGGAARRAAALRPDGARRGGAAGGSGRPQPPTQRTSFDIFLLSRQLEMTRPENSSDIRGQPAPSRRFQGATSNPPPTPFPPKPLQPPRSGRPLLSARLPARLLLRFLSSPYQTVLELVVYLAASDSSGRSFLEDRTKPFLSFESHVNLNMLPAV